MGLRIFLFLSLIPLISFSQERISIADPELEFSFELPSNWRQVDNGTDLLLVPPKSVGHEYVSLTYFEANFETPIEYFKHNVNEAYPSQVESYNLLRTGTDSIEESRVQWAIYDSEQQATAYRTIVYMFIQNGKLFILQGKARRSVYASLEPKYLKLMRSIRSRVI